MPMDVEAESRDHERRRELEGSFGFLTRQVSDVHKDLLAFEAKTEPRFKDVEGNFGKVNGRLDRLEGEVRGLRRDMPGIVGDAMRAALHERPAKPRKEP